MTFAEIIAAEFTENDQIEMFSRQVNAYVTDQCDPFLGQTLRLMIRERFHAS